ncbi:MAG: penicillin-binding protein 1C [Pseudomonadales bacterium]|nr:penicillin-binding protein 1C [Pseudomonadales bacterium]
MKLSPWHWRPVLAALVLLLNMRPSLCLVPDFFELRSSYPSSYALLLDRQGVQLDARRIDSRTDRLAWVPVDQVSPALLDALVFAEDRRFYHHHGVDWYAVLRASLKFAHGDKSRGASTITMQVASLLNPSLTWQRGGRSLNQKWRQMLAAKELEKHWSKDQILEAYINLTEFRGDLEGIGAASQILFDKSPATLTREEGLLLAALLPQPTASPKHVAARACALITAGFTGANCPAMQELAASVLDQRHTVYAEHPDLDPVAAQLLLQPGVQISSLDSRIQAQAEAALSDQLALIRSAHVDSAATLVLDNATGEVLAYAFHNPRDNKLVDSVQALRQAGSTLKPFLYELAIERRYLTAASILVDAPISLPTPSGLYAPQDYERDFKGPMTTRSALGGSINVPAIRVLTMVGEDAFWQRLFELDFTSLTQAPEYYGYSLALGSGDVSLWMLANAYRTLANGGMFSSPSFELGGSGTTHRIMDTGAAFIVADILSDREARTLTFGWESPLATSFWSAVKTGTSKDMRDNWCIGFSRNYTVAAWVGNMDGSPMHDVSGITGAAPIWLRIMRSLEEGKVRLQGTAPPPPPGVVVEDVRFQGINEPSRKEWFLSGTEMKKVIYEPQSTARILYPVDGTLIAIDPDIPPAHQRLRFHAETQGQDASWWMDGSLLGKARDLDWQPSSGNHHLILRTRQGVVLDAVTFTVRGGYR